MGVVTWFTALTNQMHSAQSVPHFTFRIPQFRILPTPSPDRYTHLTETLFARWHRNLTLTLTPKAKIIRAVKDDTETKLHTVLHLKVNYLGTVWV